MADIATETPALKRKREDSPTTAEDATCTSPTKMSKVDSDVTADVSESATTVQDSAPDASAHDKEDSAADDGEDTEVESDSDNDGDREAIYRFSYGGWRGGSICGLFIAKKGDARRCRCRTVHLGEALGKHSEVTVDFDDCVHMVTDDSALVASLRAIFKMDGIEAVGYDMVAQCLEEMEDESEEKEEEEEEKEKEEK